VNETENGKTLKFTFYSGETFEPWDFHNPLEVGIGGSETAQVEMAIRLAQRGYDVVSYSPKPTHEDELFRGVLWKSNERVNYIREGVWVISRAATVTDHFPKSHPKQKLWLVCQDIDYHRATKKQLEAFDRVFPLCTAQLKHFKNICPYLKDRLTVSSNGIRTDYINSIKEIERNPFRLMFASSPDRGLLPLLKIFKKAKERIPQLELHVFYGFNNINKIIGSDTVPLGMEQVTKRDILQWMKQPGVTDHGRIGQGDLYIEWLKSGVWCHPSAVFPETSCITSMDAQACGAIPITAPLWALVDNVKYGYLLDVLPLTDPVARLDYVDALVDLLVKRDSQEVEAIRAKMREYALTRFDWERVVDQYLELAK
jgi:glycosyltransferase involved in cell wall biosynthesis